MMYGSLEVGRVRPERTGVECWITFANDKKGSVVMRARRAYSKLVGHQTRQTTCRPLFKNLGVHRRREIPSIRAVTHSLMRRVFACG